MLSVGAHAYKQKTGQELEHKAGVRIKQAEVVALLQHHLPPEVFEQVYDELNFPPRSGPSLEAEILDQNYYLDVKVPYRFHVEADSPEEAMDLIKMAVGRRNHIYGVDGEWVEGKQQGELECIQVIHLPFMTEGDDPFDNLNE